MRDYPEEEALLHALVEDVGERPLVTFNGRSFDWPLLATRLSLHRMKVPARAHLDLLPPARRLWVDTVPAHTLGALEEHVLGLKRANDLPGWRIPQAYFDFVRTGRGGLIALAFRHNETDVVSMLALMGRVGAILQAPTRAPRRQPAGPARHGPAPAGSRRPRRRAPRACRRASNTPRRRRRLPLRRHLGHLYRREGRYDEALAHWIALARAAPRFDVEAFEQVAKLHEHRRRDFAAGARVGGGGPAAPHARFGRRARVPPPRGAPATPARSPGRGALKRAVPTRAAPLRTAAGGTPERYSAREIALRSAVCSADTTGSCSSRLFARAFIPAMCVMRQSAGIARAV